MIVVWLLDELQFTKAAVAHGVKFFHLLNHIRCVQIHETEGNDLRRMLLCRFGNKFAVSKGSEQTRREVQAIRDLQEVVNVIGLFGIKMHVHIHDAARCFVRASLLLLR